MLDSEETGQKDLKLIFVEKTNPLGDDAFIGSGVIDKIFELNELSDVSEKKTWIENNYYKKIIFGRLVKFHPPLPVKNTQISSWIKLAHYYMAHRYLPQKYQ